MELNYFAIVVSAIVSLAIGFVWYAMPVFGKKWMSSLSQESRDKITAANQKPMWNVIVIALVSSLMTAFILAMFVSKMDLGFALKGGSLLWLGFFMPVDLGKVLWEKKSWGYFAINASYYFVSILAMSAILSLWK